MAKVVGLHMFPIFENGPLTRYAKLRVVHAPGKPGTLSPPPQISDPDMHHGSCLAHVPWCMSGSLTSGFLWSRWRGERSRHSWRMRKPQYCVSGKRPMSPSLRWALMDVVSINKWLRSLCLNTFIGSAIYVDGLVKERRNSSALAVELRLSCTKPSIFSYYFVWCRVCHIEHVDHMLGVFYGRAYFCYWCEL